MPPSHDYDAVVGDYKPGSVTKIRLRNFLTYGKVEFQPGPRLNMVIGANGTGKSTILCAICLGLGGEPKLLGRADDARAFIMHEQDEAVVELTLAPLPGGATHTIVRKIERHKGSEKGNGRGASTFYINKKLKKHKEVNELIKETYNITIDNLCTFLPQDKVGSFSGFDQQALLTETEKTLSASQHLYTHHMELIESERDLNSGDNNVETIQAKLDKLTAERTRYEREKARMEEREKAEQEVDLIKKKIMWMKYNIITADFQDAKEEKKAIREEFKQSQQELTPLENELEGLTERKQQVDAKCRTLDQKSTKFKQEIEKESKKSDALDDKLSDHISQLLTVDSEKTIKRNAYEKAKSKAEENKAKMSDLPPSTEIEEIYKEVILEKKAAHRACAEAKKECDELQGQFKILEEEAERVQSKLDKVLDEKQQQKQAFFRHHPDQYKAAQWIQKNRKDFRRPVWGPVATEVVMKSANAAAFLEHHVSNAVLKGFVVEDKADYDFLYKEVRKKQKIPINITLIRNGELKDMRRVYSDTKMEMLKREHGVLGYLDETFTAPKAVMQALRSTAQVHKVLVGSEQTERSMDERELLEILSAPDASLGQSGQQGSVIFTSKDRSSKKYQTEVSRYSKKINTRIDTCSTAKMLARGGNPREKKDLQDRLQSTHEQINKLRPALEDAEKKKNEVEDAGREISGRAAKAKSDMETYTKLKSRVANSIAKMNEAKAELEADDGAKKKKELIMSIKSVVKRINDVLETQAMFHDKLMKATFSNAGTRIDKDAVNMMVKKKTDELYDKRKAYRILEQKAIDITKKVEDMKRNLKAQLNLCNKEAPIKDDNGNETPLVAAMVNLPYDDVEDAEAALEDAQHKVDSIHNDPNAVKQYNQVCEEMEIVQSQLEECQGSFDNIQKKIQQIKGPWQASLQNAVHKINTLFVGYMNEVQCTGEVKLKMGGDKGDDPDSEYKKWGIEIRVSFREGVKAQVLSAQVQSGGERAVSTIMYLMALQELMVAPFRAVDEINQGLDERNERLVFRRIVENSTRPPNKNPTDHAGQYFLITPKLLPNMIDMENEAVTPLIVMNGPYNFDSPKDFSVDAMVEAITGSAKKRSADDEGEEGNEENVENHVPFRSNRKKRRS